MQYIDYNSSILVTLLSGINLSCLDMHVVKGQDGGQGSLHPLLFSQLARSFSAAETPFLHKQTPDLPLLCRFFSLDSNCWAGRCYGVFESVRKNNPNRVFRWSIMPANSIHRHLPLSDRLIRTTRMCRRSTRSVYTCWGGDGRVVAPLARATRFIYWQSSGGTQTQVTSTALQGKVQLCSSSSKY